MKYSDENVVEKLRVKKIFAFSAVIFYTPQVSGDPFAISAATARSEK